MSLQPSPPPNPEDEFEGAVLSQQARFLLWARDVPWWSFLLIFLIVLWGVITLADEQYRDILRELLDKPSFTTDELYDVVYQRKAEVLLVKEEYVLADLKNERITINKNDVLKEEEGVLECPPNASEGCLSQRGTIVTYRDIRIPEGVTPDGIVEVEGVVVKRGGFSVSSPGKLTVTLRDGNNLLVDEANVLEQGETEDYVLQCDRLLDDDCTSNVGRYVRFSQPYIEREALLSRVDATIRHIEDGFQRTIRPNDILSRREGTLNCFEGQADCVEVPVTYITYPERIVGIEIDNGDDKRVVRTVKQQIREIPSDRIINKNTDVLVQCDKSADPRCQDFIGAIITAKGETFSGQLTFESATTYKIILRGESESLEFRRVDISVEERNPVGCTYTDEDDCQMRITLATETFGGRILKENDQGISLETVPEKIITLKESEIYQEARRTPAGCALNNPRGCDSGIWLTILVTLIAYSSALFVGLILGLLRASSQPILKNAASFYIELIRGVPLLVLLFYFAFVIGPALETAPVISGLYALVNRVEVFILGRESFLAEATIGLAIGYSAFMAEVFRAGIESIHKGQMEAARSLGMSYFKAMRYVILPQAIRVVLPPLGNEFIAILKDSALISVLALPDLLQAGRIISSREFQAAPAFTMVAWVYVVMTFFLSMGVRTLEKRSRLPR